MIAAISTDSGKVSAHFGRCPEFTIVEIKENELVKREIIKNPGHKTGFLPKYFNEKGVECVIAGGAGRRAQQLFDQFGIKLILGVEGDIDSVIDKLIKDQLESGQSMCAPGKGKGYGVKKEDGHSHE